MVEEVSPQAQDDPLPDPGEAANQDGHQHPADRLHGEVDADDLRQEGLVSLRDAVVDCVADEQPPTRLSCCLAYRREQKQRHDHAAALEVAGETSEAGAGLTRQRSRLRTIG